MDDGGEKLKLTIDGAIRLVAGVVKQAVREAAFANAADAQEAWEWLTAEFFVNPFNLKMARRRWPEEMERAERRAARQFRPLRGKKKAKTA